MLAVATASAAPEHPDIVFVLIDSLKASHLGCYGYARDTSPNLDRFAATEAVRFETVIPGGSWTQPAVMTLFTSLPADEHMRVLPNKPHNRAATTLAEVLRNAGYVTIGITANTMTNRRYGYGRGFDEWDDYSATLPPDSGMDRIATGYAKGAMLTRMGLTRLRRRDPDKPLFLFLFYMDPHWDFNPPVPYDMKFSSTGLGPLKGAWRIGADKATPEIRRRTVDAYDGEIAYCDHAVSNLLAEVAMTPRWNDTVVVVMGDHGESFWERGFTGHGNHLHDEELKVPLMIRVPAGSRRIRPSTVVRGQVGGIDVAPTVLDLAGVPTPPSWKGRSLRGAMESGESDGRPVVTETRIRASLWQRGVRTDRYKVVAVGDFDAPTEAYDLAADPGETNNLVRGGAPLPPGAAALVPLLKPTSPKGE
ncbi:MAG: sulfatase [Kiritimatiellae bacterium]|nr:sulfatase [Kiritimatiellia bacterium]